MHEILNAVWSRQLFFFQAPRHASSKYAHVMMHTFYRNLLYLYVSQFVIVLLMQRFI